MTESNPLVPGLKIKFKFVVSPDMMTQFAIISGDCHPIHTDDEYAKNMGYRGSIVYGGLLVSQISRLIGMELPVQNCVWTSVSVHFMAPLYVNEETEMNAEIIDFSGAVNIAIIAIRVTRGCKLIMRGRAEVLIVN